MPALHIKQLTISLCTAMLMLSASSAIASDEFFTQALINDETGLPGWIIEDDTLFLELNQRAPEPMRGFFEGRGFSSKIAKQLGHHCTFQIHMRNISEADTNSEIISNMADWRVITSAGKRPPILKQEWLTRWKDETVSQAARIAFRWATFPSPQRFFPGDFNWGIATFGPAPGEAFDLELRWTVNGIAKQYIIKGMHCPVDKQADKP